MSTMQETHQSDFDRAMRARWQLAARQLPAEIAWRLQPGVVAARASGPAGLRDSGRGLLLAGAMAAVFALALGLRLSSPPTPAAGEAAIPMHAGATPAGMVALEEDPDFYAWLGSDEVRALAME